MFVAPIESVGFAMGPSFCGVVLNVISSFAIILLRERERERGGCLVYFLLSSGCL